MATDVSLLTDSQLTANVADGDRAAEASLYAKYSDRVLYLALSERYSREDAEDIRAETFLRVIRALRDNKVRKPDSLSSFIVGIALNIMREYRRGRTNEPLTELDDVAGDESPEETLLNDEEKGRILAAAAQLKVRDREFLRMYYYEELPKEQIARRLGIKQERLRLIKSRALKRFEGIYDKLQRA